MILLGKSVAVWLLAATLIVPSIAWAEEEIETKSVEVTATRVERELMDVPMSVSVITSEDIEKTPASSIASLLEDVPGLELTSSAPGISRISIRGESEMRTLVLIDGQKISEQKSMDGAPILVDPANVERIEVIKGPASVIYGSDAIGGVVNIITKKTTKKPIEGLLSLSYFGANDGFKQNANIFGAQNGFKYNLFASNANYRNTKTPWGSIPNSDYDQFEFKGSLSYDFSEQFTLGVSASHFNSESKIGAANVDILKKEYEPYGVVGVPTWEMTKVGAFAEAKNVTEYLSRVRADVWYQRTYKDFYNDFDIDMGTVSMGPMGSMQMNLLQQGTAKNTLETYGASLQTDWLIGENHYLIAGYDFLNDNLESDNYNLTQINRTMFGATSVLSKNEYTSKFDGSQTTHAIYALMESTLPNDFTLTYGARYTFVESKMDKANKYSNGLVSSAGATGSQSDSHPVFNIGLVWRGIENLALRANWSQGFRVATLDQKYVSTVKGDSSIIANPNLDPETSNNFEIGARYIDGGLMFDIAAFYSLADDYITTVELGEINGITQSQYQNKAKAKTYGVEASISYEFENGFKPYASGTYMRRQFEDDIRTTYHTATPEFQGRVGIAYSTTIFNGDVDFNADVYVKAQSHSYTYSGNEKLRYDGFGTLNLAAGLAFGQDREWFIQTEVLNLLDHNYNYNGVDASYLEPGLHANVVVGYKF